MADDLDALLRGAGGLEGLAAQLGQTDAQRYEQPRPDPSGVAPAQRMGLAVVRAAVLASLARRFRAAHD
jgi:hypothetical protein